MRVGTRRRIDGNSFAPKHLLDAEHVVAVAHGKAGVNTIRAEDISDANRGFTRIITLCLSDDVPIWDSVRDKIVSSYAAFSETAILRASAGGDDERRHTFAEQRIRVVETRTIYRRRTSRIFGCTENHYGV